MRVYIGGVSSEMQYVAALDSFEKIITRDGDFKKKRWWNRGDMGRVHIGNDFLNGGYDALMLVDLDMRFQPTVLERLRSHDVDIVTGHYFKRSPAHMASVISVSADGTWPYEPLDPIPDTGLYTEINGKQIMSTGMGNVLIKRQVILDVLKFLPPGAFPFALGPLPEATNGDYGHFGADYVFYFLARKAGYKLHLDADPECEASHAATFWIDRKLYNILRPTQEDKWVDFRKTNLKVKARTHGMNEDATKKRIEVLKDALAKVEQEQLKHKQAFEQLAIQKHVINGQIAEREMELEGGGLQQVKLPSFAKSEELDEALANRGKGILGEAEGDLAPQRNDIYRREASQFIDYIDDEHKNSNDEPAKSRDA